MWATFRARGGGRGAGGPVSDVVLVDYVGNENVSDFSPVLLDIYIYVSIFRIRKRNTPYLSFRLITQLQ